MISRGVFDPRVRKEGLLSRVRRGGSEEVGKGLVRGQKVGAWIRRVPETG